LEGNPGDDSVRVNENEFFRQAALRICGSLEIGKAMADCVHYIKDFIPVSEMSLSWLEPDMGIIHNLVNATPSGMTRVLPPIPVAKEIVKLIEGRFSEWQEVKIENDPEQDPALKTVLTHYKTSEPSIMYMILVVEGTLLGTVGILAEGKGVFTRTHARLLSLLREPFAIAMSNALRYQEVLKLKDMLDAENRELSRELLSTAGDEIIGAEFGLAGVMEMVRQVAPLNSPVMLLGETGVGKEVIANAIHRLSPRADAPFIKVNCGAIPEGLLDAELFGHEKGAFTGAIAQKRGRFERADKGSIFLDEIAELPLQAQVRLLRVLQHKEIERVGGTQMIPVDVRIISATNKNLEALVRSGAFREDLWYRLNIFPIMIPPLRQRTEDIPALVHHFVEKKAKELKIHTPPPVSAQGVERLKAHHWAGNVRELENLIERELIRRRGLDDTGSLVFGNLSLPELREKKIDLPESGQVLVPLDEAMSQHIRKALRQTKGKIYGPGGAAEFLKVNPNTLRSRMRKLGITR
jgi:transcriptional regulator with GAF, ATPase, and Fis domain